MSTLSPLNGKVVALFNQRSGTALTLRDGDSTNKTPVVGANFTNAPFQHWKLVQVRLDEVWPAFTIINVFTGTALSLLAGCGDNGTSIVGWTAKQSSDQLWYLSTSDTTFERIAIQNIDTKTLVDLETGSSVENTRVQGWAGDRSLMNINQVWKVRFLD